MVETPHTPRRSVRIPDDEWAAAQATAAARGENLSAVMRALVRAYTANPDAMIECLDTLE